MSDETEPFRFSCTVIVRNQARLFENAGLAKLVMDCLVSIAKGKPGQLWGYVVLPDMVQMVIEVNDEPDYHRWVEEFKVTSETQLCDAIRTQYEHLLDYITLYNPAWTEPTFRIWQEGYHSQPLHSPYALSNRVADLVNKPVELGLVDNLGDWGFSSYNRPLGMDETDL
jgi:hypothetical protein